MKKNNCSKISEKEKVEIAEFVIGILFEYSSNFITSAVILMCDQQNGDALFYNTETNQRCHRDDLVRRMNKGRIPIAIVGIMKVVRKSKTDRRLRAICSPPFPFIRPSDELNEWIEVMRNGICDKIISMVGGGYKRVDKDSSAIPHYMLN